MNKKLLLLLIVSYIILIVPTVIYLSILIPQMSQEYNILMASGGCIGGAGVYGASKITDKTKYSGLYKLSCNAFTLLTVITIVEKFIYKLIGLVGTIILSYIIYKILKEIYLSKKEKYKNEQLSNKITSTIIESIK